MCKTRNKDCIRQEDERRRLKCHDGPLPSKDDATHWQWEKSTPIWKRKFSLRTTTRREIRTLCMEIRTNTPLAQLQPLLWTQSLVYCPLLLFLCLWRWWLPCWAVWWTWYHAGWAVTALSPQAWLLLFGVAAVYAILLLFSLCFIYQILIIFNIEQEILQQLWWLFRWWNWWNVC